MPTEPRGLQDFDEFVKNLAGGIATWMEPLAPELTDRRFVWAFWEKGVRHFLNTTEITPLGIASYRGALIHLMEQTAPSRRELIKLYRCTPEEFARVATDLDMRVQRIHWTWDHVEQAWSALREDHLSRKPDEKRPPAFDRQDPAYWFFEEDLDRLGGQSWLFDFRTMTAVRRLYSVGRSLNETRRLLVRRESERWETQLTVEAYENERKFNLEQIECSPEYGDLALWRDRLTKLESEGRVWTQFHREGAMSGLEAAFRKYDEVQGSWAWESSGRKLLVRFESMQLSVLDDQYPGTFLLRRLEGHDWEMQETEGSLQRFIATRGERILKKIDEGFDMTEAANALIAHKNAHRMWMKLEPEWIPALELAFQRYLRRDK